VRLGEELHGKGLKKVRVVVESVVFILPVARTLILTMHVPNVSTAEVEQFCTSSTNYIFWGPARNPVIPLLIVVAVA
jgi:hypothetical protein